MKARPILLFSKNAHFQHEQVGDLVYQLSHVRRPGWYLLQIAISWLVIGACLAVWNWSENIFLSALCLVVIAGRQHGFSVLLHDQAHCLIARNNWLWDRVINWSCGFPLIILTVQGFRTTHLAHHRFMNTDKDPDWTSKQAGADWSYPKTKSQLIWLTLKQLSGWTTIDLLRQSSNYVAEEAADASNPKRELLVFWGMVAVALTVFGGWWMFLAAWLFPLATISGLIHRLRSSGEHFALESDIDIRASRTVKAPWWESWLLGLYGINYHIEHHLYPQVPYYQLATLSRALDELPGYRDEARVCGGYLTKNKHGRSVISELTDTAANVVGSRKAA